MQFLSFSIDLGGSTAGKVLIRKICTDPDRYRKVLSYYFQLLLNAEQRLYQSYYSAGVPLNRLFLVKTIGDELWYFLELEDDDTPLAYQTIHSLQAITSYIASLTITSERVDFDEEREDERIWERIHHAQLNLAFKAYADVLEDCHNFTGNRVAMIAQALRNLTDSKGKQMSAETYKNLMGEVSSTLNLGELVSSNGEFKMKGVRYDPIGTDVDLFFRASKFALPGLVTIGEGFLAKFAEIQGAQIRLIEGSSTSQSFHYFPFVRRDLTPTDLKGTGAHYSVYSLLTVYTHTLFSHRSGESDPVDETRETLLKQGFLLPSTNPDHEQYKKDGWSFYVRDPIRWPN